MKRSLLLVCTIVLALCVTTGLSAQSTIPNAGFESWSGSDLNGWATFNVTRVSTPHSGSFAARGDVSQAAPGFTIQPVLQSGPQAEGFAFNQRPAAFTGFYQFFPAAGSGDQFAVNVMLFKGGITGTPVGVAAAALPTARTSYTQFSVPFFYQTSITPDTCVIQIQLIGPGAGGSFMPRMGTYYILDDLAFSGSATAVSENDAIGPTAFELGQNYPNPFNPSTRISYAVAQPGFVSLKMYNLLGEEIATLVNERKDAGSFSVNWNPAGLPSGMYLYRMSVTSENGQLFDQTKKLQLIR